MAEGPELAGGAARSRRARPRYPEISRGRERLYRRPARPYRPVAEDAGEGNARADQGRRHQRAFTGWTIRLSAKVSRGRSARAVWPHAARWRRNPDRA